MKRCAACGRSRRLVALGYPPTSSDTAVTGGIDWHALPLLGCRRCGFSWVSRPPGTADLDRYYRSVYATTREKRRAAPPPAEYFADEAHQHRPDRARRHVRMLKRASGRDVFGTVLDVGPGYGEALSRVKAQRLLAVEPDESAHPYLTFVGATVTHLASIPPGSVDAVVCSHNLEHYPPQHLHANLRAMRRTLAPDGLLLVEVPRAELLGPAGGKPRPHVPHLSFFTSAALERMLCRHGFELVRRPKPRKGPIIAIASPRRSLRGAALAARVRVGAMVRRS